MKLSELSPLQRNYLASIVGEDKLGNGEEEVTSLFQRSGLRSRSIKWHLSRLNDPNLTLPKPKPKSLTVRLSEEEYQLLEQLTQAKAKLSSRSKKEVKKITVRLAEEEYEVLRVSGKTQREVFVDLLYWAKDNREAVEKLKFQSRSEFLRQLLAVNKKENE